VARRSIVRAAVVVTAGLALVVAAGCGPARSEPTPRELLKAAELADALRQEALNLPQDAPRERLVTGLIQLRDLIKPEMTGPPEPGGRMAALPAGGRAPPSPEDVQPAPGSFAMFAPKSLVIGFFTQSKNFGGPGGAEGLEVFLQPLDQFGDPTKAIGAYRIEVFEYQPRSGEKRGNRLGHWYVTVLDVESTRKYYSSVDRLYVFPLLWDKPIAAGTSVIVQATYYPSGDDQERLLAQRVIKIGAEGE